MYLSFLGLNSDQERAELEAMLPVLVKEGGLAHTLVCLL
jgi:hypothetical protein